MDAATPSPQPSPRGRGRPHPPRHRGRLGATLAAFTLLATPAMAALEVNGSSTVTPVIAEAAEVLHARTGIDILVDPAGGSSGGIGALGDGRADVAMSSRPLHRADFEKFPSAHFEATTIGFDAVALVVSKDVWEGGVRHLSRAQARAIYEGTIKRWSEVGGPDRRIVFFNKEPGRGTWSMFAAWAYGKAEDAPLVAHPEVGSNQETRSKVAGTRGAISQLSASWADGETVFALAIERQDGEVVAPTLETIAAGRYPLRRPLLLITRGAPAGDARTLVDFLLGVDGQALVEKHGYMPSKRTARTDASP